MSVKCTGAEFNAFMADKAVWGDHNWFDDADVTVNGCQDELDYCFEGEDKLPADARVEVLSGAYYVGTAVNSPFYDLTAVLKDWLKARTTTTVVLDVPNEIVGDLIAGLPAGVTVVGQSCQ